VRDELIRSFAADHGLPLSQVREFALTIAEQCALLANRFEADGGLERVDVATVEAVGAGIGAAILSEFSSANVPREQAALNMPGWQTIGPERK
jgi:hypothetical protein